MNDLTHLRADFPILRREIGGTQVHFLDSAASSQKPIQVLEAMDSFARSQYANVHRGAYTLSIESTERFEEARRRVAAFIGARKPVSRHHAAFISVLSLFVLVFGALHYFPYLRHAT